MMPKRALLSVSNKTGIVALASELVACGVNIISTGGTSKLLQEAHIPHQMIEEITEMPEMLDGRVKTLHPRVHGAILGRRGEHDAEAEAHGIDWIDIVVVNFYPFTDFLKQHAENAESIDWKEIVEQIDIGGPSMVRGAAKNFAWTSVIVDPDDYPILIHSLKHEKEIPLEMRCQWATKAFAMTAAYDSAIHAFFSKKSCETQPEETLAAPSLISVTLEKTQVLRYGENPHQQASAYQFIPSQPGVLSASLAQGKMLSYNNILDADAAWSCLREFSEPTCVIVKHANPCGAASADNIKTAYELAYAADSLSAFGGIVALNRCCTQEVAEALSRIFIELVLAPEFTPEALAILATKPNLRVLTVPLAQPEPAEMRFVSGGMLWQQKDTKQLAVEDLKVVTKKQPDPQEIQSMLFAWRVLKHIKSNAILIAKDKVTVGIGPGQVSRVDAVDMAIRKAANRSEGTILASDAFFPFRDSIDHLAGTGVRAIIQPGGSVRDEEVITACNQHGMSMVFTQIRCFKH